MIEITLKEPEALYIEVSEASEVEIEAAVEIIRVGAFEHYGGEYSITPKFINQTLNSKNKVMDFDVDVKTIPIEKISNSSGGNTVIIGG